jgi:chorismate mutase / prephenate dehydratase
MSVSHRPVTVAYPGRDGAHSAAACERLFPTGTELRPLPSFVAVAEATAGGEVDFGVLPIESSLVGSVSETHDLLYEYPLSIVAETALRIRHCLVAVGDVPLEQIRIIRSHPVALDQCRALVAGMPWATAIAAATTADAARQVAAGGDPAQAAIASERAAHLHGLTVVAGDVGDHPEAYTRFVSVSTYTRIDREAEEWRTAFTFVTDHSPGALYRAIEPFGRLRIDLHQLVSRPIPKTPWRYRFDAVLAGHPLDPIVSEALREMQDRTRRLQVFGSYPAGRDVAEE